MTARWYRRLPLTDVTRQGPRTRVAHTHWHTTWLSKARHYPSKEWVGHMDWHIEWLGNARYYTSQKWVGHMDWHMAEKSAGGFRL